MKRLTPVVLAAALFWCGPAAAAPLAEPMYVRGGFNGWGTADVLKEAGDGIHEARIAIRPGYHGFKLGSADWQVEWIGAGDGALQPDVDTALLQRAGPEMHLFVREAAIYLFRLDARQADKPVLRIERLERLADSAGADPHRGQVALTTVHWPTWDGKSATARFSVDRLDAPLRRYTISTSATLRDPVPAFVELRESAAAPTVRSGSLPFDALFTLATSEMRQNAVAAIRDGNYNGGAAIDCACFETGAQWHYVWTRDLSYAADLGLALLDPQRVMRSLDFKLSPWRAELGRPAGAAGSADGLQIIQDTGTGGSWPASTDRVAWAFGAARVLDLLPPKQRAAFAARALQALTNTLDNDRIAAFDAADGLYMGEASFLDWREQSYSAWIVDDIASLASSKALSTNAAHYKALQLAASLAQELGQPAQADKYTRWAGALKQAINRRFWLADAGMYASITGPHFDGAPLHRFDWLGESLAIVTGVADAAQTRSILARYPHGPHGAPVIYPQQPDRPVYHNRAIWPFVTAYGLRAAAIGNNVAVADAAYASLMRGAALNLSNMENLEWLSGQALLLDQAQPALSGPVINSRRQLWSVGGYLGMVIESVFGVSHDAGGVILRPFITSRLHRDTLKGARQIALRGLRLRDKTIAITIELPPAARTDGFYTLAAVSVNGKWTASRIAWDALPASSRIVLRLGRLDPGQQALHQVHGEPTLASPALFAPPEPGLALTAPDRVSIAGGSGATTYNLYRDGVLVSAGLTAGSHTVTPGDACYAAEAVYALSGNRSHHSRPVCSGAVIEAAIGDRVQVAAAGRYQVQLRYFNGANQINLGISSGVKRFSIRDFSGAVVASGVVSMPHVRAGAVPFAYSTPLTAQLRPGSYSAEVDDFYNMSYLEANRTFSGAGGLTGPSNRVDLFGVRLLKVDDQPEKNIP
ncbi:MAG: esterase [Massilia sp.]|nr:esterase [Massilia sp.]